MTTNEALARRHPMADAMLEVARQFETQWRTRRSSWFSHVAPEVMADFAQMVMEEACEDEWSSSQGSYVRKRTREEVVAALLKRIEKEK